MAPPIPLKKITVDAVMGHGVKMEDGKKFKLAVPEEHTLLMYVIGAVGDYVLKPSQFNAEQKLLIGRFEATRLHDSQTFTSSHIYLPDDDAQEALCAAIESGRKNGEVIEPEFGYMIGYQAGKSPTGYVWTVEAMTDTRLQDRLGSVRKLIDTSGMLAKFNLPKLPPPSSAPRIAAPVADKKK